jgi:low temperature requirement protein LtrA
MALEVERRRRGRRGRQQHRRHGEDQDAHDTTLIPRPRTCPWRTLHVANMCSVSATADRPHRLTAVLREESRVTPLELFFDLVFVLALTQCTALMADDPTWEGLAKGMLVLGVMWWSWVGYAWLTSVVNPEEGAVRLVMFAAMAAFLVVALCVPGAFGDEGLLFAGAYALVRFAQIALFLLASRDDPGLRRAVWGLLASTAVGVSLLTAASFADGTLQVALWALALALDMGGPVIIDPSGWRLEPGHFAERHGLIVIIALGESIVAIGVGAEAGVTTGIVVAASVGIAIAAALWWLYFDIVALVAERRLSNASPGRERNTIARDSFSYLHFPMVAGIVLVALGLKKTIEHVEDPLKVVPAAALLGGVAIYLLAHVAFRWRNVHRFSWQRLVAAAVLVALLPAAVEIAALVTISIVAALLAALLAFETWRFAELRDRLRHQLEH